MSYTKIELELPDDSKLGELCGREFDYMEDNPACSDAIRIIERILKSPRFGLYQQSGNNNLFMEIGDRFVSETHINPRNATYLKVTEASAHIFSTILVGAPFELLQNQYDVPAAQGITVKAKDFTSLTGETLGILLAYQEMQRLHGATLLPEIENYLDDVLEEFCDSVGAKNTAFMNRLREFTKTPDFVSLFVNSFDEALATYPSIMRVNQVMNLVRSPDSPPEVDVKSELKVSLNSELNAVTFKLNSFGCIEDWQGYARYALEAFLTNLITSEAMEQCIQNLLKNKINQMPVTTLRQCRDLINTLLQGIAANDEAVRVFLSNTLSEELRGKAELFCSGGAHLMVNPAVCCTSCTVGDDDKETYVFRVDIGYSVFDVSVQAPLKEKSGHKKLAEALIKQLVK